MRYETNTARFLYYLKKYGNAKLYVLDKLEPSNEVETCVFEIDDNGDLIINLYNYLFDKEFGKDAKIIRRKHRFRYTPLKEILLRDIILSDFNDNIVTANRKVDKVNHSDEAVKDATLFILSLLNSITPNQLKLLASGKSSIKSIIQLRIIPKYLRDNYDEETYLNEIENKVLKYQQIVKDLKENEKSVQISLDLPDTGGISDETGKKKKNRKR